MVSVSVAVSKEKTHKGWIQPAVWAIVALALGLLALATYWTWPCFRPKTYDLVQAASKEVGVSTGKALPAGTLTVVALIHNVEYLLRKPGGYLANDVLPPSALLDDMPSWEYGAIVATRDLATALRNHFSRAQSQSEEDPDLRIAEPYFYFETDSWLFPPTENEYQKGIEALRRYLKRLQAEGGKFYPRADNLVQYLDVLAQRLGSYAQILTEAGTFHKEPSLASAETKISWYQLDDHLYEARGYCWALLHIMQAIEKDFAEILKPKVAEEPVRRIIRELEATQAPVLSPVVLNGSGLGLLANYSLTIAAYISHATSALLDLRALLKI